MQEKDPILRERELDGYRSIAQKIRNRLQQLENANEKDKRRWIWELLQNAIDAGNKEEVDVTIILDSSFVSFQHNGGYFQPRSVTNLVHQISSKEGTESIGRFGTGFLTTHTLSRKVEVESVYVNNAKFYPFSIEMDRTGKTEEELVLGIEKTWDLYKSSTQEGALINPTIPFITSFKYLSPNIQVATNTLKDAMDFVPYCFAFVQTLRSFKVENTLEKTSILYKRKSKIEITPNLSILSFEKTIEKEITEIQILHIANAQLSLAIEIQQTVTETTILSISENTPRLFCAYPLIGTEDFWFPFIINSILFNPKTERDGLYLNGETPTVITNKDLLESALDLYRIAIEYMSAQQWKAIWRMLPTALPPKNDDFDRDWYELSIQKVLRTTALEFPVVENEADELQYIRKEQDFCFFPTHEKAQIREIIWEFAYNLKPNLIPARKFLHEWYEISKEWEVCEPLTIEKLVKMVSSHKDLLTLAAILSDTIENTLKWLNRLIAFIEQEQPLLLEKYPLLPNQWEVFCLKGDLFEDKDKVEEELKEILFELGKDWKKEYLHTAIDAANMKVRWRNNLVQAVNGIIDRNENYRITELTIEKAQEKGAKQHQLSALKNIEGYLFNKKEAYISALKMVFANELPQYEKLILDHSKDAEMRKAVSRLICFYNEANDNAYRREIYELARSFDKTIGEREFISVLHNDTWNKADDWLLQIIITDIERSKSIQTLADFLQLSREHCLELLNRLFVFLMENEKLSLLSEKSVYPNQEGIFCKKSALFQEINLPNGLKNSLKSLEELISPTQTHNGWEHLLLDKNITAFENNFKLQAKTLKDLSTRINECVQQIPKDASRAHRNVILNLLSIGKIQDDKHKKVWEFSRAMYGDESPERVEWLPDVVELDTNVTLHWVMERIVRDIADNQFVETLQKELFGNVQAIEWLNRVIDFLQRHIEWKYLLEEFAIIPNQNEDFCKISNLYIDDGIPLPLKEVIKIFHYDWIGELLDEKIDLSLSSMKSRIKDDAATEINRLFRNYTESKQDSRFVGAWRKLQHYFKIENEDYLRMNFDWIWLHKAEITLATLGSDEEKDQILQIIESGNAGIFTRIAQGLNEKDMKELADNPESFVEFKQWKESGQAELSDTAILKKLNEAAGTNFDSLEKIAEELKKANRKINFAQVPNASNQNATGNIDWVAVAKSNEEAREKLYIYLGMQEGADLGYDRTAWFQESNTIITGVKRLGLDIKIVIKGAKNGTVYFDNAKKEQKVLQEPFSELWVYDGKDLFEISVGDMIEVWNMVGMKTYMFDFKNNQNDED
jgi:hypothetical protein